MNAKKLFSVLLLLFLVRTGFGQDLDAAKKLSEKGRFAEAETLYAAALQANPRNPEALLGSGFNYSWWKKFDRAQQQFEAAYALQPGNTDALVGLGYNAAWAGNYGAAKKYFKKLEQAQPDNPEAKKGLGYVHLWSGQGQAAERYFENLILTNPKEVEYYVALAQSNLLEDEPRRARIALKSGLLIDPQHPVAGDLLGRTRAVAAPFELDVWGGYTQLDSSSKTGLRTLQFSARITRQLRAYLKYDNSLSLDLASFARSNREAQAISAGAVMAWNPRLTSRLELGARLMPDNVTQQMVSGEQVFVLNDQLSVKGGGFFGLGSKTANEWLAYGSFRVPLTSWYAVEPYYFVSRTEGAPGMEKRLMLNNQFRSRGGYELHLGMMWGKAGLSREIADKNIYGGYLTGVFPVSHVVWGLASLRFERAPSQQLLAAALGVKLRLER